MFMTYGGQGVVPTYARIYPTAILANGTAFDNVLVDGRNYWGNGSVVIGTRSRVAGLLTLDIIVEDTITFPFPTTSIQFPEEIIGETAAYGNGQWVVTAVASANNEKIYTAKGDPLTDTWEVTGSMSSPVPLSDYLYRQLYYNSGSDSWLLSQATSVGSVYMNLLDLGTLT